MTVEKVVDIEVFTDEDKALTDEDILNMPEDEYMSPLQLEFFRLKLVAHEKEILDNAKKYILRYKNEFLT